MKKLLLLVITISTIIACASIKSKNSDTVDSHKIDLYVNILKNYNMIYYNYKNPSIIFNATIKDIKTNNSKWQIPIPKNMEEFESFAVFCRENILHTQTLPQFEDLPGNDPWGLIDIGNNEKIPSYKKLLPSEMYAMSKFSGSITGKCTTIAHFIAAVMRISGISENNIFMLRIQGHTLCLFKYENLICVVSNNEIFEAPNLKSAFSETNFYGVYNDKYYSSSEFVISKNIDMEQETLKDFFEQQLNIKFYETGLTKNYENLINYAYQSLDAEKINDYITYSLKSPHTIELASKMSSYKEILTFIKNNIEDGSIFPDSKNRIMLPDQVLVFEKGDYKDQALLFLTLMKLNGKKATIYISENNAYVEFENKIIDFSTKEIDINLFDKDRIEIISKT